MASSVFHDGMDDSQWGNSDGEMRTPFWCLIFCGAFCGVEYFGDEIFRESATKNVILLCMEKNDFFLGYVLAWAWDFLRPVLA